MNAFDLEQTLECGQCFRWERLEDGVYRGVVRKRVLTVSSGCLDKVWKDPGWRHYFDLDLDYEGIQQELSALSPILGRAAAFAPGIRILNQEPWEALCSFLISQNNNIPRIRGIVSRLCAQLGEPIGEGQFAFPTPQALCGLTQEDLAPIGSGYRARYLIDAARRVASGELDLEKVRRAPLTKAREMLMSVVGVGQKVADCVLLYGLHRLEAFPMDVWMKRAMHALFPGKTAADFGPYAGIAQQYLFHYSRLHPELFDGEKETA